MIAHSAKAVVISILISTLCGCAQQQPPLPPYHWIDDQTALADLSQRAHAVKTLSAEALLTLTRPDGSSIRLDGAVAASFADKSIRLRAWKFDQPAIDLTLTPNGLWIEMPHASHEKNDSPASLNAAQLARGLSIFGGDAFDGPQVRVIDTGGPGFTVQKAIDQERTIIARVDRLNLRVVAYDLTGRDGAVHFRLIPSRNGNFNGMLWPTHFKAESNWGSVEVDLHDIELNGQLAPGAFVPPAGARKIRSGDVPLPAATGAT